MADSIELVQINQLDPDPFFDGTRLGISADPATGKPYKVTISQWVDLLTGLGVSYAGAADTTTDPGTPTNPTYYTATAAGTYTNFKDSTGTAIVVGSTEYLVILTFDGTNWSKQVINIDLDSYVTDTEFQPVSDAFNGALKPFGAMDSLDTYASTNTSVLTRIDLLKSCPAAGNITKIEAKASQAGTAQFGLWRLASGTTYKCISTVTLTLAVGTNTFTSDASDFTAFPAKVGDYFGVTMLTGQALIYDKGAVGGCINISSSGMPVSEGTEYAGTSSNAEFAFYGYVEEAAVNDKIATNTAAIDDLNTQIDAALTESDLTLSSSTNLAADGYKLDGLLINNVGAKQFVTGWRTYRIPVAEGDKITFGRFAIDSMGYSSYFDSTDDPTVAGSAGLVAFNGSFTTAQLPVTLTTPATAAWLYITVKRPINTDADSAKLTINNGDTLLAYEVPGDSVSEIAGYKLKGGSSDVGAFSDLDDVPAYSGNAGKALKVNAGENALDLFNPAIQNEAANFSALTAGGLSLDLPSGATEPAGLAVGDAWVDTTDSTIKVKLS